MISSSPLNWSIFCNSWCVSVKLSLVTEATRLTRGIYAVTKLYMQLFLPLYFVFILLYFNLNIEFLFVSISSFDLGIIIIIITLIIIITIITIIIISDIRA